MVASRWQTRHRNPRTMHTNKRTKRFIGRLGQLWEELVFWTGRFGLYPRMMGNARLDTCTMCEGEGPKDHAGGILLRTECGGGLLGKDLYVDYDYEYYVACQDARFECQGQGALTRSLNRSRIVASLGRNGSKNKHRGYCRPQETNNQQLGPAPAQTYILLCRWATRANV